MSKEEVMSDQTARMLNLGRGVNVTLVPAAQSFSSLEVHLTDALAERVRAGQPIYVSGQLNQKENRKQGLRRSWRPRYCGSKRKRV